MQDNKYNISSDNILKINKWLLKFPDGNSKPAIIYALHLIQKENKYIESKHINAVADLLNLKEIDVYEVASFYSMFELNKVGKHTISVCTNVSCMLKYKSTTSLVNVISIKSQLSISNNPLLYIKI